jgi:hypothetical protein
MSFSTPLGFRRARQVLLERAAIILGQLLNALQNLKHGFAHGYTP